MFEGCQNIQFSSETQPKNAKKCKSERSKMFIADFRYFYNKPKLKISYLKVSAYKTKFRNYQKYEMYV